MNLNSLLITPHTFAVPIVACAVLLIASCGGSDDNTVQPVAAPATVTVAYTNGVPTPSNVVAYWNKIASDTINVAPAATGTPEEQRPNISVDLATVHVAIYDAVNAIVGTHTTFAATPMTPAAGASQEAAAAAATYGVLKGLFPNRSAQYQAAYDAFVAVIPADDAKTRGIAIGTEVATAIVALRANDGRFTAVTYTAGTGPGNFRGVNPVGVTSRFIKPFAVTNLSQFRAPPPPALDSAAYATDFNEVFALGAIISSMRSADQLEAARFHTEGPRHLFRATIGHSQWTAAALPITRAAWRCCGLRRPTQLTHALKPSTSLISGAPQVRSDLRTLMATPPPQWIQPGLRWLRRQIIPSIRRRICVSTLPR